MKLAASPTRRPPLGTALAYVAVALAACSWGTWPLALRHAEAIAPMPAALESTIVMGVITIVSGLASVRDRRGVRPSPNALAWVVCLGVTDAFNVGLFFSAYKITVAVAVLAHYLAPVFVAIASPLVLRERVAARTVAAVVGSLAGLALMLVGTPSATDPTAAWLSAALAAGSALFYAANVIANKFVVGFFSTSEAIFYHGLVATPLLAAFVPWSAWGAIDPRAIGFLAAVAVGPGGLAALAFLWGLRRMPAARASTLTLIEPLVAVLLGAAVFGEDLGWRTLLGGAMILAGAVAVIAQPTSTAAPIDAKRVTAPLP